MKGEGKNEKKREIFTGGIRYQPAGQRFVDSHLSPSTLSRETTATERNIMNSSNDHKNLKSVGMIEYFDYWSSEAMILSSFDDNSKIVVVCETMPGNKYDYIKMLKLAGKKVTFIQAYSVSFNEDGISSVIEEEGPPSQMYCTDYYKYYTLCNEHFQVRKSELKEKRILFDYCDPESGNTIELNIFSTILYAIDIPIKYFPSHVDTTFREQFKHGHLFLPAGKYCYQQFVSTYVISRIILFNFRTHCYFVSRKGPRVKSLSIWA